MKHNLKHTPGDWAVDPAESGGYRIFSTQNGANIAFTDDTNDRDLKSEGEDKANAHLMAASPDLLAALEESQAALMEMHKQARGMWNELLDAGFADKTLKMPGYDRNLAAIDKSRAAIAKATQS